MSFRPELLLGVGLIGLAVAACAYPRALLMLALISLAVRPELFFGGAALGHEWGIQHTLLTVALIGCAWRYGFRREINWPILAFGAAFALSLLLGDLHPDLTASLMVGTLGVLCLPWAFTQVELPPGSRRWCALVLALLPSVNILVALLLQSPELVYGLFEYKGFEDSYRLEGAAGDAGPLAVLAFAGFAVALHESTRPGRPWAPMLATINLGIVILTVTRMGILASLALLLIYAALSPVLRERILRRRGLVMLGGGLVLVLFAATLPSMLERVTSGQSWILSGGRSLIWPFYHQEFLASPLFGRGFGTGFLDISQVSRKSPHNEYLHLLVVGGVFGLVSCLAAIGMWFRRLLSRSSPNDREFLFALIPAVAMFAVTEDILTLPVALAVWIYLGMLLTRPGTAPFVWETGSRVDDGARSGLVPPGAAAAAGTHDRLRQPARLDEPLAPQSHRFEASLSDPAAPLSKAPGASRTDPGVVIPPRRSGEQQAWPGSARLRESVAEHGGSDREWEDEPFPATPPDGTADAQGSWVRMFPTARRLALAVGADKLITLLLLAVLASLAIGSDELFGAGDEAAHKLLLLVGTGLTALYCGVRLLPNWVAAALLAVLPLNLLLADRFEDLSAVMTAKAFVGLLIPWIFVHAVFDRRARISYCVALTLAPIISVLIGLAPDFEWTFNRLGGATNAAFLGASGFFGFAISAHEYGRRRHTVFVPLGLACLIVVVLSGSRMAWLSTFIFGFILYLKSLDFRDTIKQRYSILVPGLICVVIIFALYLPYMEGRVALAGMSNRDNIWAFFLPEVDRSPLFGRGLGASEALRLRYDVPATHNEYIRMLVDAGIVGCTLFLIGIVAWFRHLLRLLPTQDRAFVWAMVPCLAMYGATDNILAMVAALAVFVYFGIMIDDRSDRTASARH